jgi:hypothetical protein
MVIAAAALSGCGGAKKQSNPSAAPAIGAHAETAAEAAWRTRAQQFAHDLDTGLQALATTASTDSYAAVANLGPLAYCASNLEALGSTPSAYELARGSFEAACEELSSGASLWQSEVNSNGQDFEAAAYAIRRGRRLLTRGEERLTLFQTKSAPLQGEDARRAQLWARKIDRYWTAEIESALASVDRELRAGASNPIQALWDEHSGGDATTVGSCSEILDRSVTSPPDAQAQHVLDQLHAACGALESAADISNFEEQAYQRAKAQMRAAITALRVLAP